MRKRGKNTWAFFDVPVCSSFKSGRSFPINFKKSEANERKMHCIRTMANSLFIREVNRRMNVCRVHLKGMEVAFTVAIVVVHWLCQHCSSSSSNNKLEKVTYLFIVHCAQQFSYLQFIYLFIHFHAACRIFCLLRSLLSILQLRLQTHFTRVKCWKRWKPKLLNSCACLWI